MFFPLYTFIIFSHLVLKKYVSLLFCIFSTFFQTFPHLLVVGVTNAIVHPRTVMIELGNAARTHTAMMRPIRLDTVALEAKANTARPIGSGKALENRQRLRLARHNRVQRIALCRRVAGGAKRADMRVLRVVELERVGNARRIRQRNRQIRPEKEDAQYAIADEEERLKPERRNDAKAEDEHVRVDRPAENGQDE